MKNIKILKAGSKLSALLSLILLFSLNLKAQNSSTQKLYVCLNDAEPNTKQFLAANHIDNLVSLDQRYIDPHNTHQLDVQTLTNAIIQQIPDSSSNGIAVLDLEGSAYDGLDYKLNANSDEYKQIIKFYIQTIKLAKSLRPNIKWGFYGMPFTARQKPDERWKTSNNNISPILQLCDVFCPSLYINGVEPGGNQVFVNTNMQGFLAQAYSMNKMVLPFIWNRYYYESTTSVAMHLIPINDFKTFVSYILTASYKGKKADGVISWSADSYYFYQDKTIAALKETTPENFHAHHDSVTRYYANELLKTINHVNGK